MKVIGAMVCTAAAIGLALLTSPAASATDVHCNADRGVDVTVVDGRTGCRAAADILGRARAAGYDGVGYANATAGAAAYALGIGGGVGASEGSTGVPIAIGIGHDAVAFTSLSDVRGAGPGGTALSISLSESRALVYAAQLGDGAPIVEVVCLGAGAFAWDVASGKACVATPFGSWKRS